MMPGDVVLVPKARLEALEKVAENAAEYRQWMLKLTRHSVVQSAHGRELDEALAALSRTEKRAEAIDHILSDLLAAAEAALAVLRFDTPDVWRDRLLAFIQAAKAKEVYAQLRAAIAKARGTEWG